MKTYNNQMLTSVVVGVVGLLLIIFEGRGDLLRWIAILIGIMFIVPSAMMLASELKSSPTARSEATLIASLGGLGLGVCMCVVPGVFVGIFIYLFALMLILGGVYQMIVISRIHGIGGTFYIIPAILVVTGVVMLCAGIERDASAIVLIAGIGLVLYAANSLAEGYRAQLLLKSGSE